MFDYDDTLVGRGNSQLASSKANKELLNEIAQFAKVGICTGNSIKAINLCSTSALNNASLNVFADGGINLYEYTTKQLDDEESQATFKECIQQKALLSNANELVTALIQVGIPAHKIENRGNAMLSIKPIEKDYREIVVNLIKSIITSKDLVVKTAGRTTVEIMKAEVTKRHAVISVLQSSDVSSITYVGDELVDGNDSPVLELSKSNGNIKCLSVKGPAHTCLFLTALLHASGNV
jgi:HAD superfamily hydrolase (TIGR01484 family)